MSGDTVPGDNIVDIGDEANISIVGGEIPVTDVDKSECAPHLGKKSVCSKNTTLLKKFLKPHVEAEILQSVEGSTLVDLVKEQLGVKNESEIYEHSEFKSVVGSSTAAKELRENFKPSPPGRLLNDSNIDETLAYWAKHGQKLFGKKFHHVRFQMIDFDKVGSELSTLDVPKLITDGYDCFGCVLNTDVSTGGGKHWFCIYGDLAHEGTAEDPYLLEYFNSSGNPVREEVYVWLTRTVASIMKTLKKYAKWVTTVPVQLQYSKTECGMWSLLYIKSRLDNEDHEWFYTAKVTDDDMIKWRKYLFRRPII